jgi:hypothetical protein
MRRWLVTLVAAALLGSAAAQVCSDELRQAIPGPGATLGQAAAALFAEAVRQVEPAWPGLRGGEGPVAGAGAAADAVTYLHRRRLLPEGWTPEGHTPDAWAAMWANFAAAYRIAPPATTGVDVATMVDEAARALEAVADAVRPLPVFAVDGAGRVTLFVVMWNWTPYPRLLVFRVPPGTALAEGDDSEARAAPVLEALGGCALRFDGFAYAAEDVALRLFVDAGGDSTLRLLGSEPPLAVNPPVFAGDDVVAVLRFEHPALAGSDVVSVAIEGPSIGVGSAIVVLANVRTNLGLDGVLRSLALP